ncbi:hypothetical protein B0H13DRAFT_1909845 [Mycena leptocephala]|nr:hypothetical protein B0H13DRAFT_1909845 [Mycena leptocephala]
MPPYERAISPNATQHAMPPQKKLDANQVFTVMSIAFNDPNPPVYLSLEDTIQSIQAGEVGSPRSATRPKSTSPSPFDAAADKYDTALLRRADEAIMLLGMRPHTPQPLALMPARRELLGTLHLSPAAQREGHREMPTGRVAPVTKQPTASTKHPSQFSQLFPEGLCAAGDPPRPSLADIVIQNIDNGQAAGWGNNVLQPSWECAYPNIRGTAPRHPTNDVSNQGRNNDTTSQFADTTPRCPLGAPLRGMNVSSTQKSPGNIGPSPNAVLCTVGIQSPTEFRPSVTKMEDRRRGILGEIMNGQYIRRRESD